KHGIPIENALEWANLDPYSLREGKDAEKWRIRQGYTTVQLNFDREPRFYAWLGFDGGQWYGQQPEVNNPLPNDLSWIASRSGGSQQKKGYDWGPVTGYFLKKMVHYQNRQT